MSCDNLIFPSAIRNESYIAWKEASTGDYLSRFKSGHW